MKDLALSILAAYMVEGRDHSARELSEITALGSASTIRRALDGSLPDGVQSRVEMRGEHENIRTVVYGPTRAALRTAAVEATNNLKRHHRAVSRRGDA